MTDSRQHKTKLEFAQELGMSPATLYRRIRALNLMEYLDGRLLTPQEQDTLRTALDAFKRQHVHNEEQPLAPEEPDDTD